MAISVTDPLDLAIKKTRAILFEPFNAGKWFALGFSAWLATLGSGGSSFSFRSPVGNFGGTSTPSTGSTPGTPNFGNGPNPVTDAFNWLQNNEVIAIGIVVAISVIVLAFVLLFAWLGSRGQFMLIDNIVKDTDAVKEPWHEFEREGNSVFKFKLCYGLLSAVIFILVTGACILLAYSDINTKSFGPLSWVSLTIYSIFFLLFILVISFIDLLLGNFVVPTMFKRRINLIEAFHVVRDTFMPHKGTLGLYFLFLIVLHIGTGIVAVVATLCLCCIPAFPYFGAVILLPLTVFMKSYTLYFLEQFGPEWQFFTHPTEVAPHLAPDSGNSYQDSAL